MTLKPVFETNFVVSFCHDPFSYFLLILARFWIIFVHYIVSVSGLFVAMYLCIRIEACKRCMAFNVCKCGLDLKKKLALENFNSVTLISWKSFQIDFIVRIPLHKIILCGYDQYLKSQNSDCYMNALAYLPIMYFFLIRETSFVQ